MANKVLDGTDLILSVSDEALGYSTSCKISTTAETGERVTKEARSRMWTEKYVKKLSESITADGFVLTESDSGMPTYDVLKAKETAGEPVTITYSLRDSNTREGDSALGYTGEFIITSLELNGPAGDDSTYSIQLENSGAVTKVGTGLTKTAAIGE